MLTKLSGDLRLSGKKPGTCEAYEREARKFIDFCQKPVQEIVVNDLREYLLVSLDAYAASSVRTKRSALMFLFEETLGYPAGFVRQPAAKTPASLPFIFSREQIAQLMSVCTSPRDRAIFSFAYGSGLRVGEICSLKNSDVDSRQMRIQVTDGKGGKDRFTILAASTLAELRECLQKDPRVRGFYEAKASGLYICSPAAKDRFCASTHCREQTEENREVTQRQSPGDGSAVGDSTDGQRLFGTAASAD